MGVFDKVKQEIVTIGGMVMIIVILSLVLLKMKSANPGNFLCTAPNAWYNSTADLCCLGTETAVTTCTGAANQTAISSVGTGIDNTVSAIDEPITWISIVVVAIVGIVLVRWFTKNKM